jgi:class 3 adenylate cyclase
VRRTYAGAYGTLVASRQALAFAAAGYAVFAILLGSFLALRTTRPIRSLVELTRDFAARKFEARSTVKTGDELEALGIAMEQMADSLATSEAEIARRAKTEATLSRYVPAELAQAIVEGRAKLELGGERREVTVLFADVVAFTTFAEDAPPERAVAFLNELFSTLTEVVFRHGGTVDKFLGDCVMAIFGAPSALPEHASKALAAAEDMHRFVEANAPAWKETYGIDVKLGIGVSTGVALVGNLGSASRMEYTAIGDVVNVAARLEGLARPGQTLVTSEVVDRAGDGFDVGAIGEHPLRGKRQPVRVFELR